MANPRIVLNEDDVSGAKPTNCSVEELKTMVTLSWFKTNGERVRLSIGIFQETSCLGWAWVCVCGGGGHFWGK